MFDKGKKRNRNLFEGNSELWGNNYCIFIKRYIYYKTKERPECALLNRESYLAVNRGVMERGDRIVCPFNGSCDGGRCFLLETPEETDSLNQQVSVEPVNQVKRFYGRLEISADRMGIQV